MNKQQAYDRLKLILKETDDVEHYILGLRSKLNIILLKLKLENAHIEAITSKTGIVPIAEALQKIINDIEDKIQGLVDHKKELKETMVIIKKELEVK